MKVTMNCNCPSKPCASPTFGAFLIQPELMKDIANGHFFKYPYDRFSPRIYEKKMWTLFHIINSDKLNPVINRITYDKNKSIQAECFFIRSNGTDNVKYIFDSDKFEICEFFKFISDETRYTHRFGDDPTRTLASAFDDLKKIYLKKFDEVTNRLSTAEQIENFKQTCHKRLQHLIIGNYDE